jgi:hypothetical protein
MQTINHFITESKKFSRNNWWIYILYFLMLFIIIFTEKQELVPIIMVTSIHFVADIFIMMMFGSYSRSNFAQGTYYQIISLLLFLSLKIYTGLIGDGWHYLMADPVYILAAVKNYKIDVRKSDIKIINPITMTILSFVILLVIDNLTQHIHNFKIISSSSKLVQTIGIFLFAIALSTTSNERLRYQISLVALTAMVGGSAWETFSTWENGKIAGLAISYTLLPLTVLIFYLKKWPDIMKSKVINSVADFS